MKAWLSAALLGAVIPLATLAALAAEPPVPAPSADACLNIADNFIVGPRTQARPLPLVSGDPAHGFRMACSVPWSTLSPKNQPLAIIGCFSRGSLLQVANDAACGRVTGKLWVDGRWVVTSRDLTQKPPAIASCQKLETTALAATRDINLDCVPQDTEAADRSQSTAHPAAANAPPTPSAPSASPAPRASKDSTPR